jgi:choline dehydrogenase
VRVEYHLLGLARIGPNEQHAAVRQTVGTARHVSGTCKMGPDADPMAVVDQYCRVKGVQGLWVADASVMPRIPRSGGAHATVIMIGERVVDWIA